MIRLMPFGPAAAALWLLALGALAWVPAEGRAGFAMGWAVAGVCGLLSFGLLAFANRRSFLTLMGSVVGGFLGRLVLVGAAILFVNQRGWAVGWFCLSFFGLYWILLSCEFLAVRQGRLMVTRAGVAS